jgi:hypothetical protein
VGGAAVSAVATFAVTKRMITNQTALAVEERRQSRLQGIYQTLQIYIEEWASYAQSLTLNFVGRHQGEFSEFDKRQLANLTLFASRDVADKVDEFTKNVAYLQIAVADMELLREQGSVAPRATLADMQEARAQLKSKGRAVVSVAEEINALMRDELGSGRRKAVNR